LKYKLTAQELIHRARHLTDSLEAALQRQDLKTANECAKALQGASYGLFNATREKQ
jgi:HPt (histidine-containing phosphotransfer) domain-containing protein